MNRIYLDAAATTPVDPRVFDAMLPFFQERFGNASSVHEPGRTARSALEHARGVVAQAIGAQPGEVTFTSGGTESDNLAVWGVAHAAIARNRRGVITSSAEHHAVLDTAIALREIGCAVALTPTKLDGTVDLEAFAGLLRSDTALVSVMHGNNEIGSLNPLNAIAARAHEAGATFHSDAVQSFGKIPVNVDALGVDLLTISAHKIYGPKGIGALYVRKGTEISPLFHGGGQERGRRPGTENVALAVGFARAAELILASMETDSLRITSLRNSLEAALVDRFPFLTVNGATAKRLPHIVSVSVDSQKLTLQGEMLVPGLDLEGVCVSNGSACTSGSVQPSHVIIAIGRDEATARATVRFSFGRYNTREELVEVIERMEKVFARMRS